MFTLPIDEAKLGTFYVEGLTPVMEYGTDKPKLNEQGHQQYRVSCRYKADEDHDMEQVNVKIYLPSQPKLAPYAKVKFAGVTAFFWENGGRSGLAFNATQMGLDKSAE